MATGLLISAAAAHAEAVMETSLCELAKLGKQMDGRHVRLKAVLMTDNRHFQLLKDKRCPKVNFDYVYSDDKIQDPSLDALDKEVMGDPLSMGGGDFSVDVTGVYHWRKNIQFYLGIWTPHNVIIIKKVWHFKRIQWGQSKSTPGAERSLIAIAPPEM